jgi:hypothetical protein
MRPCHRELPLWDKTNSYDFLRKIRRLNRSLPKESRVHIYPCDIESDWSTITKEIQQQVATIRVSGYDNKDIFPKSNCEEKIRQWLRPGN